MPPKPPRRAPAARAATTSTRRGPRPPGTDDAGASGPAKNGRPARSGASTAQVGKGKARAPSRKAPAAKAATRSDNGRGSQTGPDLVRAAARTTIAVQGARVHNLKNI